MAINKVPVDLLRIKYQPDRFKFATTAEVAELTQPPGQERVLESLRFGTDIEASGYNIYALGPAGIGKHQIVEDFLKQKALKRPTPDDWVYVNNFSEHAEPIAISFAPREARIFQKEIKQFIEDLRTTLPSIYETENYRSRRDNILKEYKTAQDKALEEIQERARKENLYLITIRSGLFFAYGDKDGNVIADEDLAKLPGEEQKRIDALVAKFNDELATLVSRFPILERQMRKRIKDLNSETVSSAVETLVHDLKLKYQKVKKVADLLISLVGDVVENSKFFRGRPEDRVDTVDETSPFFKRYEVNVIVDHSLQTSSPVIYEDNPTFMNIVGQTEYVSVLGTLVTDFTLIQAGALHKANGGYLILDTRKLLSMPYAWEGLKRALKSQQIRIESLGQVFSLVATGMLKPEPIPLNCKVILIGERYLYDLLTEYDPEFSELFRVSADFDIDILRDNQREEDFVKLLASLVKKDNLRHLSASAVIRLLEESTRLSGDSERISINLRLISDLLKESDFFAKEDGKEIVTDVEVQKALDAQYRRTSRIYEKLIEETTRGTFFIDVEGKKVGQVNGLSVFEFGNHLFGHPHRITAISLIGDGTVVDIEREVKTGGPIHSKGVLILSGFLKSRFANDVPLSVSASLVFEQSYGWVEGDSASLAELAALLSSLSEIPLKQSVAITGSINQLGQVQPVGAINEKVESFFDLCKSKNLTGEQGVIIPQANVKHLALREDVIKEIKQNKFYIYAVDNIEDCMQLMTGSSAPIVFDRVDARLRLFADKLLQRFQLKNLNELPKQQLGRNLQSKNKI